MLYQHICGTIFEHTLCNSLFIFQNQNDLIPPAQSVFKPSDSCINQLLSITHEIIYHFMDDGYAICGVFLDVTKAFDEVWHEGLAFKFKQNEINSNLLIILDFLRNMKQRVVLNGQASNWENIHTGVPAYNFHTGVPIYNIHTAVSILGPVLFLIYVNDLAENLSSNPKLFADDTSYFLWCVISANEINDGLKEIEAWAHQRKMRFNHGPFKQAQVIFSQKNSSS